MDLLFAKIPSFENPQERELNASVQVFDRDLNSRVFTYTFQIFDEDDRPESKTVMTGWRNSRKMFSFRLLWKLQKR